MEFSGYEVKRSSQDDCPFSAVRFTGLSPRTVAGDFESPAARWPEAFAVTPPPRAMPPAGEWNSPTAALWSPFQRPSPRTVAGDFESPAARQPAAFAVTSSPAPCPPPANTI